MKEINQFNTRKWIRIALINFFIVAFAGVLLRYKINFPLPLINQKFLLHGHSHFAFVGWVSLALMAMMVNYLNQSGQAINYKKYHWLFIVNTVSAYGMLLAFILQGYAFVSISFSTLSIFVSYLFSYYYWKDLRSINDTQHVAIWFKSALLLLIASSAGPFTLAYLMASHNQSQILYTASIYFFLHFQYNGWFIFACFGLLFSFLNQIPDPRLLKSNRKLFLILISTIVPNYLLSLLGYQLPAYLYWIAVIAAVLQLGALFYGNTLLQAIRCSLHLKLSKMTAYLWSLASISFVLKLILQALSIVPYLGNFAFSFRSVVIGYLHLCFLGVISFFILGYFNELLLKNFTEPFAKKGKQLSKPGLFIFIAGVLLQEFLLLFQGLQAIIAQPVSNTGINLFFAAIVMAAGLAIIVANVKPLNYRLK